MVERYALYTDKQCNKKQCSRLFLSIMSLYYGSSALGPSSMLSEILQRSKIQNYVKDIENPERILGFIAIFSFFKKKCPLVF
ncbi:hypothetical protein CLU79DRAFT_799841 [Phycomyces nitens]|nr:hypothetical protein CLU79DRAFT_799841 [Phycomyces nitens]